MPRKWFYNQFASYYSYTKQDYFFHALHLRILYEYDLIWLVNNYDSLEDFRLLRKIRLDERAQVHVSNTLSKL